MGFDSPCPVRRDSSSYLSRLTLCITQFNSTPIGEHHDGMDWLYPGSHDCRRPCCADRGDALEEERRPGQNGGIFLRCSVMQLNVSCPGGLMNVAALSSPVRPSLPRQDLPLELTNPQSDTTKLLAFVGDRRRRGGGNVGIGFIDFQGLWKGRKTALSFSGLSINRHFHRPLPLRPMVHADLLICSNIVFLACCMRRAASVSLIDAATRFSAASESPGRRNCCGRSRESSVSSGVRHSL